MARRGGIVIIGFACQELMPDPIIPFLRQIAADPAPLRARLAADRPRLAWTTDPAQRLALLGRCGEAYRMLGDLAQAVPLLAEAVSLARRLGDPCRLAANAIRLATADQYRNEHQAALPLFYEALTLTRAHPAEAGPYEDFALQHLGKCLVELGRFADARACFDQARTLRQAKGDPALRASTDEARAALEARAAQFEQRQGE